ncbi:MAG: hypothetical protein ACUVRR_11595 [Candidatus Fervidibacter sp.]
MRKEIPTWVAVVVILVVLVIIVGAFVLLTKPRAPEERPPIEMGAHPGPMKMKGGEMAPTQPPR